MIATLIAGVVLGAIVSGIAGRVWDERGALAAAVFAGLAIVIQLAAVAIMHPVRGGRGVPVARFMGRWGIGMGLRLLGVIALALAVGLDRTHFPPLPVALGFLGVLLPLLALEAKLVR